MQIYSVVNIKNILSVEMKQDLMSQQTSWTHLLEQTAESLAAKPNSPHTNKKMA